MKMMVKREKKKENLTELYISCLNFILFLYCILRFAFIDCPQTRIFVWFLAFIHFFFSFTFFIGLTVRGSTESVLGIYWTVGPINVLHKCILYSIHYTVYTWSETSYRFEQFLLLHASKKDTRSMNPWKNENKYTFCTNEIQMTLNFVTLEIIFG